MTQIIYKYTLNARRDLQTFEMPQGATILTVQVRRDDGLSLWAMVDPDRALQKRVIEIIAIGDIIRELRNDEGTRKYIGTVQLDPYGHHIFERITE